MTENRWLYISIGLVAIAAFVAYSLFVSERERQRALDQAGQEEMDLEASLLEEQSEGTVEIEFFYYSPGRQPSDSDFLVGEKREIFFLEEPVLMSRQIVQELLRESEEEESGSPDSVAPSAFFAAVQLRQLFLLDDGTAVVDLSFRERSRFPSGILPELAFLQSVTRTLRTNVPEIERVRFLVDGAEDLTLAGHVSLRHPFM